MPDNSQQHKSCFGVLDRVFPMQPDGLRETPAECLACPDKTACLKNAVRSRQGLRLTEETIDRAYAAGNMGFIERWSKRKAVRQKESSGRDREEQSD